MKICFTLIISFVFISLQAQTVFFEEDFNDCVLPADWITEQEFISKGWVIGNSDYLSSDLLKFPDNNGNCFAANNDSKWDDDNGNSNNADNDMIILPYLDLSEVENLVVSMDYISGYSNPIGLYVRTENNPDWLFVNNTSFAGGVLQWQEKHIYAYGHVNAPIKDLSEPVQFMFRFTDYGFAKRLGAAIDNIKIYEPLDRDLVLRDVHVPDVVPVGMIPIKPALFNHGLNILQSAKIKWQIDDGDIKEQTVSSFFITNGNAIPYAVPFGTGTFPGDEILVDFQDEGEYLLKVWYEQSNGQSDDNPENNYWEKKITVVNELPTKHFIYEKFSHHTCSPCYEADLLASQIAEEYENIHIVSVHSASSDPMDYPIVDEIDIAYSQRTHPSTMMDRRFFSHWQNGTMNSLYETLPVVTTPWWSPVDVYFTSKEVLEEIGTIELEIEAEFVADVEGEYRFNIWTIEDGIEEYQAGAPNPNSYIHNHVLRNYSGGNYGAEESMPLTIEAGEKYKYGASISIDPDWNLDELSFIAIVQRYEKDSDDREIVNSSIIHVQDEVVTNINNQEELELKLYPNPSSDFVQLVLPSINHSVSYSIFNELGQLINRQAVTQIKQNYIQIDVRNYAQGTYIMLIEIDGKEYARNIVVNR